MTDLKRPICPNCGQDRGFGEVDEVLAYLDFIDPTGYIEWTGDTDLDTQKAAHNPPLYECLNCSDRFPLVDLLVAAFGEEARGSAT